MSVISKADLERTWYESIKDKFLICKLDRLWYLHMKWDWTQSLAANQKLVPFVEIRIIIFSKVQFGSH